MRIRRALALSLPSTLLSLAVLLALLPAPPSRADLVDSRLKGGESRTVHRQLSLPVRGRAVALVSPSSDLTVRAGQGEALQLEVEVEYWSTDEGWMERVAEEWEVEVAERAGRIEIEPAAMPRQRQSLLRRLLNSTEVSWSVTVQLTVPPGTALELSNRYGDVDVAGTAGPLSVINNSGGVAVEGVAETEIENKYGDTAVAAVDGSLRLTANSGAVRVSQVSGDSVVRQQYGETVVEDVGGSLELHSQSGRIEVTGVAGNAEIEGSYGDAVVGDVGGELLLKVDSGEIRVEEVRRSARIRSSYGAVEAKGVDGSVTVEGASTAVSLRQVGGAARVKTSYAEVEVVEAGSARVENPNGAVTLRRIAGDAYALSSYATVRAADVGGSLTVAGTSSSVSAEDVKGAVEVETSYDGVVLDGVGGAVRVKNQSGRVVLSGLSGAALTAQHRLETSYADVEVSWPSSAPLSYRLEATYGTVECDFPGTLQDNGARHLLNGRSGQGGGRLEVIATSGSIRLRQR